MLEYGEESEPIEVLAATLPSTPGKPKVTLDAESVNIAWEAPSNPGGGDVEILSYSIHFEANNGDWVESVDLLTLEERMNIQLFCDGNNA